jgi:hypothetical protein
MNINEMLKATGTLTIERKNFKGQVVETIEVPNLVVTVGKNFIASRMAGTASNVMSHMAIGTDNTAASVGQTGLITEVARVSLTSGTASTNSVTYVATFPAGTPATQQSIVEAAILNASSSGTMLCRTVFPVVTKQAGDSIAITWVVTVN